jgi:hypothetical protein
VVQDAGAVRVDDELDGRLALEDPAVPPLVEGPDQLPGVQVRVSAQEALHDADPAAGRHLPGGQFHRGRPQGAVGQVQGQVDAGVLQVATHRQGPAPGGPGGGDLRDRPRQHGRIGAQDIEVHPKTAVPFGRTHEVARQDAPGSPREPRPTGRVDPGQAYCRGG